MKNYYILLLIFLYSIHAEATRPTVHASNLQAIGKDCKTLTLSWTNGNGMGRMVIASEDSLIKFTPQDSFIYNYNSQFGSSVKYNEGAYIVFNGVSNSVFITNLKQNTKYYFTVIEHDNNGVYTQYYSNSAPSIKDSTYHIEMDFSVTVHDSCERKNSYTFTNNSVSNIPNTTYFYTYDQDSSFLSNFTTSLNGFGYKVVYLKANHAALGCPNEVSKQVLVFRNRNLKLDFSKLKDSIQFYPGNYFEMKTQFLSISPYPHGILYKWWTGDGDSSTFPVLKKTYNTEGRYRIVLETTVTRASQRTNCKDTLSLYVEVLHDAFLNFEINASEQTLDSNLFEFSNIDSTVTSQTWTFGDGTSAFDQEVSHSYSDTGEFDVSLFVETNYGYSGTKWSVVRVLPNKVEDSVFSVTSIKSLALHVYPNPNKGLVYFENSSRNDIDAIRIYDTAGKLVFEELNPQSKEPIHLETLNNGVYTIQLVDDTGKLYTSKLQIQSNPK
ncbi:MAG: PKD domain-containing protein [Bacteroidia bacterium]